MRERLGETWSGWIEAGLPVGLLVSILVLAVVVWLTCTVLTAIVAARHHRGPLGWSLMVAVVPVLLLGLALAWPVALPWIAAGSAAAAGLLAVLARGLIVRADSTCPSGHRLAPDWVYCPHCPPAKPASGTAPGRVAPAPVPSPMVGMAAPQGFPPPVPAPMYASPAPRPDHRPPEPPAQAMIRLLPESNGMSSQMVSVRGALLGRNPSADIPLEDQAASWDHARIVDRDGSPAVVDLGSSNGTFVNEERVETSLLIPGDRLRIGETTFKVVS